MADALRSEVQDALGGSYAIERELGRGGMGAVYLARDLALDRLVAIKVLPPELAVRHELRERFLRESRTTAAFSHPHIVPVHAIVEQPQLLGFVMGYVEGESVTAWVARTGPLSARDALRLLREVAWGLSYAHGRGIIHRDVKPDNILIERATGRALVTDFGIARSSAAQGLTAVGEVVGTPQFMSPEQAAGDSLDGRTDLYSLGVVAWYALTGKPPFEATSAGAVMAMHLTQALPPLGPLRPDLPRVLVDVVERSLAKDPARRFQTGEEFVSALDAMQATQREVPPAVRLFHQRLGVVAIGSFFLLLFGGNIARRALGSGNDLDALIFGTFILALVLGLAATLVRDARQLLLRGFQAGEVRDALRAITAEEEDNRAQLRANAAYVKRLRVRRWTSVAFLVFAVAAFAFALSTQRTLLSPGRYGMSRPGMLMSIAATVMFGTALVTLMTSSLRGPPVGRLVTRLWSGVAGRLLFRIASWKLPTTTLPAAVTGPQRGRGPRAVLLSMTPAMRKELGDVAVGITKLESESAGLDARVAQLEQALQEARAGVTPGAEAAGEVPRAAFAAEADAALTAAKARRQAIATSLEAVRMQLLRISGGLGSADDVRRALGEAIRSS